MFFLLNDQQHRQFEEHRRRRLCDQRRQLRRISARDRVGSGESCRSARAAEEGDQTIDDDSSKPQGTSSNATKSVLILIYTHCFIHIKNNFFR